MKVLKLQTTGNCNAFFSQVLLFVMCKSSFTHHVCDRPEKLFLSLAVCTDMYHLATKRRCVCVWMCVRFMCVCVCEVYVCVCVFACVFVYVSVAVKGLGGVVCRCVCGEVCV